MNSSAKVVTDSLVTADKDRLNFSTCASDLNLPPCSFPDFLETTLGSKKPFVRKNIASEDGEVKAAGYIQKGGYLRLVVWND